MDDILRPRSEGPSDSLPVLDARGFIKKYPLPVGQAKTFQSFEKDYAFFTPAILYLHGNFNDTPLLDLCCLTGTNIKFYFYKSNVRIFQRLEAKSNGNADWNFVLWAVAREHWKAVSDFLVSITLSYSESREVAGIGEQNFQILDPLAVSYAKLVNGNIPLMSIAAFGLNTNNFRAYFTTDANFSPPTLTFGQPVTDMQVFADALYNGANPVNAKNRSRETKDK